MLDVIFAVGIKSSRSETDATPQQKQVPDPRQYYG
jgi:hypothetical protein